MTHRFVVPSAFEELLLAEQTMATLCSERLGLDMVQKYQHGWSQQDKMVGMQWRIQDDLIDDVQCELAHTGPAKLLDHPMTVWAAIGCRRGVVWI